jgi:hypothetical protein
MMRAAMNGSAQCPEPPPAVALNAQRDAQLQRHNAGGRETISPDPGSRCWNPHVLHGLGMLVVVLLRLCLAVICYGVAIAEQWGSSNQPIHCANNWGQRDD